MFGVEGGVMLIVSECFSSIHTNLYSLLDTGSNTGNRCPRASRGGEFILSAYGRSDLAALVLSRNVRDGRPQASGRPPALRAWEGAAVKASL